MAPESQSILEVNVGFSLATRQLSDVARITYASGRLLSANQAASPPLVRRRYRGRDRPKRL